MYIQGRLPSLHCNLNRSTDGKKGKGANSTSNTESVSPKEVSGTLDGKLASGDTEKLGQSAGANGGL